MNWDEEGNVQSPGMTVYLTRSRTRISTRYIISDWILCVFELQKPWGESSRKLTLNNQDPRIIPGVY